MSDQNQDQNESFDLNVLREMFKSEAYDLLAELENALLALEESPRDKDVISRVFRALHTIKGSGGACGFDDVSHFAHQVEALYDAIRNDKTAVTKEIINLTLAARDQIAALFDGYYRNIPAEQEITDQIVSQVQRFLPEGLAKTAKKAAAAPPLPADVSEKSSVRQVTYRIRFRPSPTIFQTGTDPQNLIDELKTLGPCRVVAQLSEIPDLEKLNAEECHLYWDVILTTDRGIDAIKDVFIFVQDVSELTIEPLDEAGQVPGEMEYKKLGELLVERGDLNHDDIHDVMQDQRRLGEILVERGLVNIDKVEAALTEQQHVRELQRERQKTEEMTSIRVRSDKLDKLVDLVGELVTVQARLSQIAAEGTSALLLSIAEEVERLTAELRDNSMSIRMMPIGTIFNKYRRVVRDLSQSLGKSVDLFLEGTETELDKTVIEKLHDPLVHLIRNCIDHGIEMPDTRAAAGKPRQGTIRLTAEHSGAHVLIRIEDDGGGMNAEAIRRKAIEKGLIAADAALPQKDLFSLVLLPGFSTAKQVTDVSGRGVGMDVVKQAIDALRGTIDIVSVPGQGTTITLSLPLTLAIIDGFLTRIGSDYYVLPLSLVDECVELKAGDAVSASGRTLLNVRGELVPYIKLRKRFAIPGDAPKIEQVVIAKVEHMRVGFVVDHIVGGHQTVIKNLGKMYKKVEGISGATILGDGSVALILDVLKLVQGVEREEVQATSSK
ncbi:MAG: chemotaxis protein CheA [Nitrospirota bacterium]|nr:chemotaxis protein CheA [Nitrospirota bacterium]